MLAVVPSSRAMADAGAGHHAAAAGACARAGPDPCRRRPPH